MTTDRWQQIDRLFEAVLEAPASDRAALFDQTCAADAALRREVEQLLAASEAADGFFEATPMETVRELFDDVAVSSLVGSSVGPYRLVRELGRGGMGLVWLAERADEQYRQQVAIKLLWPGMDNAEVVRRFRRERQILANLHHPNIAQLYDGGMTADERPYFVMEYVAGVPITDYCNAHRLPITERLRLFGQVCAAVQYAHQNLVIHRDLKPGNILVTPTAEGKADEVKLLDFGIAKLLDPARHGLTAQPTTHALMMTPEYASPEQMRGETLTTASDVYGLGVLLYELLTGHLPYQLKSRALPEIIRAVCEDEPFAPSKLSPALRGDLEVVTLTALSKEVAARYASVEQLSAELQRYLEFQPILTRKLTWRYRAGKFVRRNRLGVLAATALALVLAAGVLTTLWQAGIAIRERARAEEQAMEANHQRAAAESQAAEARKQQSLAEQNASEAGRQKALAETQTAAASQQQQLAEAERHRAQNAATANRQLAYSSQMHNGAEQWELANLTALRQTLANHLPKPGETDLRGFEWYYLWRLLHHNAELTSLQEEAEVWSANFSPDGKLIATGNYTDGNDAKLFDAVSGKLLGRFLGHKT